MIKGTCRHARHLKETTLKLEIIAISLPTLIHNYIKYDLYNLLITGSDNHSEAELTAIPHEKNSYCRAISNFTNYLEPQHLLVAYIHPMPTEDSIGADE